MMALTLAALFFVASHVLLSSTPLRTRLARLFGKTGFLTIYVLVSVLSLGWLIVTFFDAPRDVFWEDPLWTRGLLMLAMPIVSVLLVTGITAKNPTMAVVGRPLKADEIPGIFRVTRHPVMWALAIWSGGHMLANGDAASLIFFGAFLTLSFAGPFLIERKKRVEWGSAWGAFAGQSSVIPFAAIVQGRTKVTLAEIGWGKILFGLLLYAAFMLGHQWLSGVALMQFS